MMQASQRPIGVFDSGIGGLSVLRALRAELPCERFVYLADSGHAPYGERGDAYVASRTHAVTHHLQTQYDIKALVVACNTATAAAIHELRHRYPALPLIGLEPAIKPAVALSRTGHIGVIGTRGTLTSQKFGQLLHSLQGQAHFIIQPCDGLAYAIERGIHTPETAPQDTTKIGALCTNYIGAMGDFGTDDGNIDTLVLGCTHYVFAEAQLRSLIGPAVRMVDTGEPVARQTRRVLEARDWLTPAPAAASLPAPDAIRLWTTGSLPHLQAAAAQWLQLPPECCDRVDISTTAALEPDRSSAAVL